ncbi:MAG: 5-formyltetrahydrofolate cyclo-ligase [Roseinatronobacter sp.]
MPVLSGYIPMRGELDPIPSLQRWPGNTCLPVVTGKGHALSFVEWSPGAPLTDGSFGTRIPAQGAALRPDIVIVPLLAFDRQLYRLGYGGGFYDRTLQDLRAGAGGHGGGGAGSVKRAERMRAVVAIGFACSELMVADLPRDSHDQPLDAIATPDGVIWPARPG